MELKMAREQYALARETCRGFGISPKDVNMMLAAGILRSDIEVEAFDSGESGKGAYIYFDGQASVPGNVLIKRDKVVDDAAQDGYERGYKDGYEDGVED